MRPDAERVADGIQRLLGGISDIQRHSEPAAARLATFPDLLLGLRRELGFAPRPDDFKTAEERAAQTGSARGHDADAAEIAHADGERPTSRWPHWLNQIAADLDGIANAVTELDQALSCLSKETRGRLENMTPPGWGDRVCHASRKVIDPILWFLPRNGYPPDVGGLLGRLEMGSLTFNLTVLAELREARDEAMTVARSTGSRPGPSSSEDASLSIGTGQKLPTVGAYVAMDATRLAPADDVPETLREMVRLQRVITVVWRVLARIAAGRPIAADLPLVLVATVPLAQFARRVLAAPPYGESHFQLGPWSGMSAIECSAAMVRDLAEWSSATCDMHGIRAAHFDRLSMADGVLCAAANSLFQHLLERVDLTADAIREQGERLERAFSAWLDKECGNHDFRAPGAAHPAGNAGAPPPINPAPGKHLWREDTPGWLLATEVVRLLGSETDWGCLLSSALRRLSALAQEPPPTIAYMPHPGGRRCKYFVAHVVARKAELLGQESVASDPTREEIEAFTANLRNPPRPRPASPSSGQRE